MGLPIPDLDDRTYRELREDALKRLPVLAPSWTDHNAHDPGVTVLETLAWLTETYLYQFDQVTDAHVRKYLALVGAEPAGPTSARVSLRVTPPAAAGATDALDLPKGLRLSASLADGTTVPFATTEATTLTRARVTRVVSTVRGSRIDNTNANATDGLSYQPFGSEATVGNALYLGFDADHDPFAAGALTLAVDFHEDGLRPPAASDDRVTHEPSGQAGREDPVTPETRDDGGVTYEPPVRVSWEYCTTPAEWYDDAAWQSFPGVDDTTNHLYHGGRVTLPRAEERLDEDGETIPGWSSTAANSGTVLDDPDSHYWIRGRLVEPDPPDPSERADRRRCEATTPVGGPRSDSPRRRAGGRARERSGLDLPPRLNAIRLNVVEATQEVDAVDVPLRLVRPDGGTLTTARPDQRFRFDRQPIRSETVVTRMPEDPTDEVDPTTWTRTEDFDTSGPDDRHYVRDRTRGEIVFGDGIRGAIPDPGQVVEATAFSYGGGRDGNVPPSAVWRVDADAVERGSGSTAPVEALARLTITPLGGATGGREAETVSDTVARVRRDRRTPTRGVSLADFEYLARHTPGLRVDRATAIADVPAPDEADRLDRPHVVRVVVVPDSTLDRPVPSDAFLDAVQRHLDARTLLTDCVVAEPPAYVGVGVVAEIGVAEEFTTSGRVAAVAEALDRFLSPVRRPDADGSAENPDGDGWPLGRPVYPSEVYEVIDGVDGVDCVFDVSLRARGAGTVGDGRLPLPPTGLPYPLSHDVRVRTVDGPGRRDR